MCAASLLPSSLRGRCIKVTDYTSGTDFDPRFRLSGVEADEENNGSIESASHRIP